MIKFNRYVVLTEKGYFNTITKKIISADISEKECKNLNLLQGQEYDLIIKHLLSAPQQISINLASTWECTLRCSHCSVLHKLKKESQNKISATLFQKFLNNYYEKYLPSSNFYSYISFVGGEIGIQINDSLELLNVVKNSWLANCKKRKYTCTTNLFYDITTSHLDFFNQLDDIYISIDGNEESHNKQRKKFLNYTENENPYVKSIKNIDLLCVFGLADKIKIQASLEDDVYFNIDEKLKFFELFLRKGIKFENISWYFIHPTTLKQKQTEAYKNYCKNVTKPNYLPCCKYRYMNKFCISPTNEIYSDYFQAENQKISYLGQLDDSIEEIEKRYAKIILEKMPVLKDQKCLSCPVIGYCWGQCINSNEIVGLNPSEMCNQKSLIEQVETKLKIKHESCRKL
jgi:radical SAM protein with 4Fe4S-binding SPASM domain